MKRFRRFLLFLLVFLLLMILGLWFYLRQTAPQYKGSIKHVGLEKEVEVLFDEYGIPHIYAQNAADAYKALGYVHAQDRLFQMEMVRRLASGRLAEILGPDLAKADQFFRTLGFRQKAEQQVALFFNQAEKSEWQQLTQSYLDGINAFIDHGPTPPEFRLIGIPKTHFDAADVYATIYYMSLGFAQGMNSDAFFARLKEQLGPEYVRYWNPNLSPDSSQTAQPAMPAEEALFGAIRQNTTTAGIPLWTGSNGWVLAPSRTVSGRAILANDTHIKFSQPSVWYEAYMEYPGFSFYGYHLAGVPFPIIGHNDSLAWGLTIYPIDNLDLYAETTHENQPNLLFNAIDSSWIPLQERTEIIKVKGGEEIKLRVQSSPRGPIINEVVPELENYERPVSLWWSLLQLDSRLLETLYLLQRAQNLPAFEAQVSGIDIIGLNVLYADAQNHIAWWGCGKIPERNPQVNPFFLLDASNPRHLPKGSYLPFEQNPHSIDPPEGVIVTANNRPQEGPPHNYPGYYLPDARFLRISHLLSQKEKWDLESLKAIQGDVYSLYDHELAGLMAQLLDKHCAQSPELIRILKEWDGNYNGEATAPTLYNRLLYRLLQYALSDEMGEENFQKVLEWYAFKSGLPAFVKDARAPWWDDINTSESVETREAILCRAWQQAVQDLRNQLGEDYKKWQWAQVHTLTHEHPLGKVKPLDKFFNVGPFPIEGGNAVPLKMEYTLNEQGLYPVITGPALRILLDFENPARSLSINPTGQSGHFMSPHYSDQAEMFVNKVYRREISKREDLGKKASTLLLH